VTLTVQMMCVAASPDQDGCLILDDGCLVAVLVCLSEAHGAAAGRWFYEAGFGSLDGPDHPTFPDLASAKDYVRARLGKAAA
jgi:hypothetical protein